MSQIYGAKNLEENSKNDSRISHWGWGELADKWYCMRPVNGQEERNHN